MGIQFNADEVLAMAMKTEKNGAAFYRKAALNRDEADSKFLLDLAAMEDEHERIFGRMRERLAEAEREETAFDPENEAGMYLDAMADGHGGEGAPSVADLLTGKESLADILRTAIELEKKSILFYVGLQDMVPPKFGKDRVGKIIQEEKTHIVVLTDKLRHAKA